MENRRIRRVTQDGIEVKPSLGMSLTDLRPSWAVGLGSDELLDKTLAMDYNALAALAMGSSGLQLTRLPDHCPQNRTPILFEKSRIERRKNMLKKEQVEKICKNCGKSFKTGRTNKIYCSQKCQWEFWNKKNPRIKTEL
jgi:hypothetical protein